MKNILDVCCGSRMMWLNKSDSRAVFMDRRCETHHIDIGTPGTIGRSPVVVNPDVMADFTKIPFHDESFQLVVFDPPHIEQLEETAGILTKKYGNLIGDWRSMIRSGFAECFRVLKPGGTLIFKWCEVKISLREILELTPEKPLFGHRSGKQSKTHWCAFLKPNDELKNGMAKCSYCDLDSTHLCDAAKSGGTCDKPMCDLHTTPGPERNVDFCREHAHLL